MTRGPKTERGAFFFLMMLTSLLLYGDTVFMPSRNIFFFSLLRAYNVFFAILQTPGSSSVRFSVITSEDPVVSTVGADAALFCRLSPGMSAERMDIRWFRTQFHSPVHRYLKGKDENDQQLPDYQGRTELLKDDIRNGSVGLKIRNVRISDEGQYKCFFEVGTFYDEAIPELKVAGIGSAPHIHIDGHQDGGIRVVCKSAGWYPEPLVLWRWDTGESLPSASVVSPGAAGLFDVENALIIHEASKKKLSCSIRNTLVNEEKAAIVTIDDAFFPRVSAWAIVFPVVLAAFVFCVSLLLWCICKEKSKRAILQTEKEATIELLSMEVEWRRASRHRETLTLDRKTAYPKLFVSEDSKVVTPIDQALEVPDNEERFDTEPCILGLQGFTAGKHYWEIEVHEKEGRFWSVGVVERTVRRKGGFRETIEDGFLVLRANEDQFWALTSPPTSLSLTERPRRIGVYLDIEGRQLKLYDADSMQHIHTFEYDFTQQMFPFFYIGQGTEFKVS